MGGGCCVGGGSVGGGSVGGSVVGVNVGIRVSVGVSVGVGVNVHVGVGVKAGTLVGVGCSVISGVKVLVGGTGVDVSVGLGVGVAVRVGRGVGEGKSEDKGVGEGESEGMGVSVGIPSPPDPSNLYASQRSAPTKTTPPPANPTRPAVERLGSFFLDPPGTSSTIVVMLSGPLRALAILTSCSAAFWGVYFLTAALRALSCTTSVNPSVHNRILSPASSCKA